MKKAICLLTVIAAFTFISCSKDKPATNPTATIEYKFTTDKTGNFNVEFTTDSTLTGAIVTAATWSKTVTINKNNSQSNTATFVVHPPFEWATTTDRANVTSQIIVDGVIKASDSAYMGGIDRPAGLTITANF
ncbi:MAG: hypothetical protein ABIT58_00995 [Ferruginibacter sp.]